MSQENNKSTYGQELFTQELVKYEKVHVNVSQSLIITTEDRMLLWLNEVQAKSKANKDWIAPLSLCIAITLTLTTASFKNFILPSDTWYAIFIIADIFSLILLIKSLLSLKKPVNLIEEISKLRTFSQGEIMDESAEGGKSEQY